MAYNAVVGSTQIAAIVETTYRRRFMLDATERFVIAQDFADAEVEKIGNGCVIRRIATKTAQLVTATAATDPTGLTWEQDTEVAVTCSPTMRYGAVSLNKPAQTRIIASAEFRAGVKEQLMRAIVEAVDQSAGDLASAAIANVSGSNAVNLDQSLILDGLGKLRTTAKRMMDPLGNADVFFNVHPKQLKNLFAINNYMNAQFRGESNGPVKSGVVVPGWGLTIKISGNVDDSSGALHNFMLLKDGAAIGYNAEAQLLPEQPYGLDILLISFVEAGVITVNDQYIADVQTSNA